MANDDLGFANKAISAEERLANLVALAHGFSLAMAGFCRRVDSYGALLEEELEGRPAAVQYLAKCRQASGRALAWAEAFRQGCRSDLEFEPLDIRLVLEAVVRNCQRIVAPDQHTEVDLGEDEILVDGSLFQLQDLFSAVLRAALLRNVLGSTRLKIHAGTVRLEDAFLRLMKSPCVGGEYFVVSIGTVRQPFVPAAVKAFWDTLLDEKWTEGAFGVDFLLVYGILLGHRGDLFLGSAPDGSRVLFLALPVRGRIKEMQAPHNLDEKRLGGTETILLVDDEDMIWDVIIDMLQELGYTVLLAANGRDAVEIYRANPGQINLVLLDMVMPEMDGHEAFFELKKIDPTVKVLLSSGYVSEEEAKDALGAGAAGFLRKPYRMVDLARRIRGIFDRSDTAR